MTDEQDTGNRARLPLAERTRRGLDLMIADIMRLEFAGIPPHEGQQREDYRRWRRLIEHDILFEALPVRLETGDDGCLPADEFIARPDYLAWRCKQASPPMDSRIESVWLGDPTLPQGEPAPVPQGEPDQPEPGAAAKRETELQMHRRECKEIGKRLWAENPNLTQAKLKKHPEMQFYVSNYRGKNTVSGWLAEIDPRPKEERRGRPKKIPV